MNELLAVAVRAARAGGEVIDAARASRRFAVSEKSAADFVTEVDVASERAVVGVIREAFPDHDVLAEEGGGGPATGAELRWVIDPLDGTTNFIHDIPIFGVAVAVERRGVPVAGVILDPVRGDLYHAVRGGGAWRGEERLAVSGTTELSRCLVLTGIPFRELRWLPRYLPGLERVARATAGIRRMGSAALDLAYLAAGRAEGFWEYGLSRWDLSAGVLLVEEAGGRVTDLAGSGAHLDTGHVLATNGSVHDALLACVRDAT